MAYLLVPARSSGGAAVLRGRPACVLPHVSYRGSSVTIGRATRRPYPTPRIIRPESSGQAASALAGSLAATGVIWVLPVATGFSVMKVVP